MQNTVRLILVLFLGILILANYNSLRILNMAMKFLGQELDHRTAELISDFSTELNGKSEAEAKYAAGAWAASNSVPGIVVYGASRKPILQLTRNLPAELSNPLELVDGQQSATWNTYFLRKGTFEAADGAARVFVVIFNQEKVIGIERSAKIISYSNFLLLGLAALLTFYVIESTLRPYRVLVQTVRSAHQGIVPRQAGNEADFLIDTFQGVIARLRAKEHELEKLHQSEKARADDVQQLNQDLVGSISSGLILVDENGQIRLFNQAAEKILGYPSSETVNQHYSGIIQKISPAFREDIDRCIQERANINRAEVEVNTPGGELHYVGANIMPLRNRQGAYSGVICLFSDITEFKILQQHMAQKEKYASLGEMAGGVAHEFRNSVATIAGYSQLLEKKLGADKNNYIAPIQKELHSLQKVVDDFLSFARPVALTLAPTDIGELLRECIAEAGLHAGPSTRFCLGGSFPQLLADETMLRQVFLNLLRNAVEAVEESGRKGKIEITGTTSMNGKLLVLDVRDNGVGIREADLPKIFTPFYSTKQKGVGLGLAIVQKLVLQHNGTISVESGRQGTVFRLQLPIG